MNLTFFCVNYQWKPKVVRWNQSHWNSIPKRRHWITTQDMCIQTTQRRPDSFMIWPSMITWTTYVLVASTTRWSNYFWKAGHLCVPSFSAPETSTTLQSQLLICMQPRWPQRRSVLCTRQPAGVLVSVEPTKLVFNAVGEKQRFKVILKPKTATTNLTVFVFGALVWSDGPHFVRSPIAVSSFEKWKCILICCLIDHLLDPPPVIIIFLVLFLYVFFLHWNDHQTYRDSETKYPNSPK